MILLLHEIGHTATYFLFAIITYHLLKLKVFPWLQVMIGYVLTIGMDADHLFDYLRYVNFSRFNFQEFIGGKYFKLSGHVVLPMHAWEWVIVVVLIYFLTGRRYKMIAFVAVAILAQLVFDVFSHGFDPRVYSIIYRGIRGFPQEIFMPVLY